MRLGPQNFACYAAALTALLSLYVVIGQQPLFACAHGRLCPLRALGLAVAIAVFTGGAAYGIGYGMLRCCAQ